MTSPIYFDDQFAVAEGEVGEVATDGGLVGVATSSEGMIVQQLFQSKLTRRRGGLKVSPLVGETHPAPTNRRSLRQRGHNGPSLHHACDYALLPNSVEVD